MGAIASGGVRVLNPGVVKMLSIPGAVVARVAAAEQSELERRERVYRGDRPFPVVHGRTVILVDDGIATGSTIRAAAAALRLQDAGRIVVAAPVAARSVVEDLREEVDEVVCVAQPRDFLAISTWYDQFPQLDDKDVRAELASVVDADLTDATEHEARGLR